MKIMVNGTEKTLSIIGENGIDWIEDMIDAPDFYNRETETYEMDEETYQYWLGEVSLQQQIDALIDKLTPEYTQAIDAICEYMGEGIDRDYLLSALQDL